MCQSGLGPVDSLYINLIEFRRDLLGGIGFFVSSRTGIPSDAGLQQIEVVSFTIMTNKRIDRLDRISHQILVGDR
jgi:hypothetical protein